jgi:hypothetical protein
VAHRKVLITALAIAAVGALAACSVDKEADAASRKFNDELRAGTTAGDPAVGAPLQAADAQAAIAQFHATLPADAPTAVKNTGFNFNTENGNTQMSLTYEYDFAGGKVINITDVLAKNSGQTAWSVIGFRVEPAGGGATENAGAPPPATNGSADASGGAAPASNAQGN